MAGSRRRPPRKAVGPRLRWLLRVLLVLFALLAANSVYLGVVSLLEWQTGRTYQDYGYQLMFGFHLLAGLLLLLPALLFIGLHTRNTWTRPNRRAVYAGLGLFGAVLLLLLSGLLLVRFEGFEINHPGARGVAYWAHVIAPLLCVWLFLLHRLAGPRIRWRAGLAVAASGLRVITPLVVLQLQDPRDWGQPGRAGSADFTPALVRSATGNPIPGEVLMRDEYCAGCHQDAHDRWQYSAHRFASFNNPVYLFAVRNTRKAMLERDGDVRGARFCAGCHDLVPLLSGAFDDPGFDDQHHPTAQAGITCTSCHAITHVNSARGNGDFTIEEPIHYPFAFSRQPALRWLSRQLIKANPDFHKRTFLKPLHQTAEFCGTCHKVHLPEALNDYRWLRGQNHYDGFLLSGVSGHGVSSFYYPPRAQENCNGCHMPLREDDDFAARDFDASGRLSVHDHLFPAANTGLPSLLGLPDQVNAAHQEVLETSLRIDLIALREAGRIDGALIGPLRPALPALRPGRSYLVEAVVRTLGVGHPFTEGTADSNEVWVELEARLNGELIGHSGRLDPQSGEVDPWSHFINAFVLDGEGRRIDRRNPEDILVPLYNHQIPPGAADLLHYRLELPADADGELELLARVHYRKFDTALMRYVQGADFAGNKLPITLLAEDRVRLPVGREASAGRVAYDTLPAWERWNDYGIGALRKPQRRQLRQAEEAFRRVEALQRSEGALNLARVYLQEGRLDEAAEALARAGAHPQPALAWSRAWFGGLLLKQQGRLREAIDAFQALVETRFAEARERGFDFSRDYRLLNELGQTWVELSKGLRGAARAEPKRAALAEARRWFEAALQQDPENPVSHYNLALVFRELGDELKVARHAAEHARYRVDDNARDRAIALARQRYPAARAAADPVAIYDLQRDGRAAYAAPAGPVRYSAHTP
jgi:tetratricopeptide (TPR) repeat protein